MSFDFKWPALLALLVLAPCAFAAERGDITIADFNGKDYGDWKVEGEAFGSGPAPATTLPNHTDEVKKALGEGLVSSGDETTGTLTSPEFTIERNFLNLLVGGGGYEDKTCVNLLVDGKVERTAMGPNTQPDESEALSWVTWDVKEFADKKAVAVIQIVDDHTGDGGHINVDHIVLSDTEKADQPWWSALWSAFLAFPWWTLLRLAIALPLPWFLGYRLANYLRMKDYGWKLGVIFCALASAGVIVQAGTLPLGVDLEGGDILVYEIDRETLKEQGTQALTQGVRNRLIEAISNRINPSGTKEIIVRQYGDWQIEIIIPKVDRREIDQIKKLISTAGSLEFRIVAKRNHAPHEYVINLAETQAQDPNKRRSKNVRDSDGTVVGYWARVDREEGENGKLGALRVQVAGDVIRNATTGELVSLGQIDLDSVEIDVLMIVDEDPRFHVKGEHLGMVSRDFDETMRPCVRFNMRGQGAGLMGALTGSNLPDEQRDFYQRMAILLDGSVLSAPRIITTISDRGQITGTFTVEEVEFLVGILHAGSLPAAVNEEPISENQIGAVLGEDTIQRGKWAIGISLGAVLVFILFWYRFAGIVACLALATNLLLILALMMSFNAAMTLPGLAGLVLTVGMSVDANVLIFERLREELNRGAALRMAIRNGFSRATTTIVDANLTTLITALVLYAIGTDQIRGFAVTLILGILMSMFTAIFCARVVFDLFERKRRLKSLKMRRMVGDTHIDFIGRRTIAAVVSTLLIFVGLVAVGVRGAQIFDIDFAGGTSVTMVLEQPVTMVLERPTSAAGIRSKLDQKFAGLTFEGSSVQYSVNRVEDAGQADNTVWKIDSSIPDVEQLQEILKSAFPEASFSMQLPTSEAKIRSKLDEAFATERVDGSSVKYSINRVDVEGQGANTVWKIDSSFKKAQDLQKILHREFPVATYSMDFGSLTETRTIIPTTAKKDQPTDPEEKKVAGAGEPKSEEKPDTEPKETSPKPSKAEKVSEEPKETPKPTGDAKDDPGPSKAVAAPEEKAKDAEDGGSSKPDESSKETPKPSDQGAVRRDLPPDNVLAMAGDGAFLLAQADPAKDAPSDAAEAKPKEETVPAEEPAPAEKTAPAKSETPATEGKTPVKEKPAEKPSAKPADDKSKESTEEKPADTEAPKPKDAPVDEPPKKEPAPAEKEKPTPEEKPAPAKDETVAPEGEAAEEKPAEPAAAGKDGSLADKPADDKPAEAPETGEGSEKADVPEPARVSGEEKTVTRTQLKFAYEINGLTLKAEILDAAAAVDVPLVEEEIDTNTLKPVPQPSEKAAQEAEATARATSEDASKSPEEKKKAADEAVAKRKAADDAKAALADWWIEDSRTFKVWDVSLVTTEEKAREVFEHMQTELAETPFWLSSSAIGGQVAGDTRTLAIAALLTSLLGIVGYIWIRFQRVIFGLAAVIALVHDVLITLGAIAVSYWLASVLGFLLIEEFKISLPVVAALLTIIGYSLNDTIVVFDRIREVRGKSPELTGEMINTSINQTLGRTLLTSLTTFVVVAILYAFGGQGIHAFAFCLVIGVIVGTYSSIFVASPALLWMSQPKKKAA